MAILALANIISTLATLCAVISRETVDRDAAAEMHAQANGVPPTSWSTTVVEEQRRFGAERDRLDKEIARSKLVGKAESKL